MARKKNIRNITDLPSFNGFKPIGIKNTDSIILLSDEYETIRLIDYNGLKQEEVAEIMNVSRPTVTRIYEKARIKISKAIIEGKSLLFHIEDININQGWQECVECGMKFNLFEGETNIKCPICNI